MFYFDQYKLGITVGKYYPFSSHSNQAKKQAGVVKKEVYGSGVT